GTLYGPVFCRTETTLNKKQFENIPICETNSIEMSNLDVTDYENFANNVMPHLDYEIEDFQHYTWRITGWRNRAGRVESPRFIAGGWGWRIVLYPLGDNNNTEYISIYLEIAPHGAPNDWHSCA
ncbi:34588_t:CDS:2, partial [Racocetra persica]